MLRINHRRRERSNRENRIDEVSQKTREEIILPFIQYLFSLELDDMQTNCFMSSGYYFHGFWVGSVLRIPLDTAGGCSCQQLPGQSGAWAPQHGQEQALRNRGLLFSNRWFLPNLLSPSCISNTEAWFREFCLESIFFAVAATFVCCMTISITSSFCSYFALFNQTCGWDSPGNWSGALIDGLGIKPIQLPVRGSIFSYFVAPFFFFFNFWGTFFREAMAWERCLISKFCWWC